MNMSFVTKLFEVVKDLEIHKECSNEYIPLIGCICVTGQLEQDNIKFTFIGFHFKQQYQYESDFNINIISGLVHAPITSVFLDLKFNQK